MAITKMLVALMGALSVSAIPNDIAARSALSDSCISAHSQYRNDHGAGALVWDDQMAADAAAFAQSSCSQGELWHSVQAPAHGQNAYASTNVNTEAAIKAWGDEGQDYDYSNPGFTETTGHFTQVVWKNARKFGCGWASSPCNTNGVSMYRFYCNYDTGNVLGEFEQNVLPPGTAPPAGSSGTSSSSSAAPPPSPHTTTKPPCTSSATHSPTTTTKPPSYPPAHTNHNGPVIVYTTVTKVYGATATAAARPKRPHHHYWKPYTYNGHVGKE